MVFNTGYANQNGNSHGAADHSAYKSLLDAVSMNGAFHAENTDNNRVLKGEKRPPLQYTNGLVYDG